MIDKTDMHANILTEIHELYCHKNADYGDSFAQLRERYPNFVCMRVFDKLNRIDNIMNSGKQSVLNETIEDTLMDIANYCVMEILERRITNA